MRSGPWLLLLLVLALAATGCGAGGGDVAESANEYLASRGLDDQYEVTTCTDAFTEQEGLALWKCVLQTPAGDTTTWNTAVNEDDEVVDMSPEEE